MCEHVVAFVAALHDSFVQLIWFVPQIARLHAVYDHFVRQLSRFALGPK
jgi:hypothetical protein